jgi:hypothetical protein
MEWSIRPSRKPYPMLLKRVLVVVLLLPVGLAAIYLGGLTFTGLIALIMVLAAREYVTLFRASGQEPSRVLVMGGVLLIVLGRSYNGFESGALMISLLLLASMAHHLFRVRTRAGPFRHRFWRDRSGFPVHRMDRCLSGLHAGSTGRDWMAAPGARGRLVCRFRSVPDRQSLRPALAQQASQPPKDLGRLSGRRGIRHLRRRPIRSDHYEPFRTGNSHHTCAGRHPRPADGNFYNPGRPG